MLRYQLAAPISRAAVPAITKRHPQVVHAILARLNTTALIPEIDAISEIDAQSRPETFRNGLTAAQINRRHALQRELADLRKRRRAAEKQLDFLSGERGRQRNRDKVGDLQISSVKAKNEIRDLDQRIQAVEGELQKLVR